MTLGTREVQGRGRRPVARSALLIAGLAAEAMAGPVWINLGPAEVRQCGKVWVNGAVGTSDGSIVRVEWNWGDGATGDSSFPALHQYATAGSYTITATGISSTGASASASVGLTVTSVGAPGDPGCGPVDVVLPPPEILPCGRVVINAQVLVYRGSLVSEIWEWGDGTSSSGSRGEHVYSTEGVYSATFTVRTDEGATSSAAVQVTVSGLEEPRCAYTLRVLPQEFCLRDGRTTQQLRLDLRGRDGRPLARGGRKATFTSSDPTIATVDGNGLVTGVSLGDAQIAVSVEGVEDTSLAVAHAGSFRLEPAFLVLSMDGHTTGKITADARCPDGSPFDLTDHTITWVCGDKCGPDKAATVTADGTVTANFALANGDQIPFIWARLDGNFEAANTCVVQITAEDMDLVWRTERADNATLIYPETIGPYDHVAILTRHDALRVVDTAVALEHRLTNARGSSDGREIIVNYVGPAVGEGLPGCGGSGYPVRCGTVLETPEHSCFLEGPDPRYPAFGIYFHEMGHNLTWTSERFGQVVLSARDHTSDYSEGLATACGMFATEMMIRDQAQLALPQQTIDAFGDSGLCWRHGRSTALADYCAAGADYDTIYPDVVDDMVLAIATEYGWDTIYRFFSVMIPGVEEGGLPIQVQGTEQQATALVAAFSAGAGVDLRALFRDDWGFPIDDTYYATIFPAVNSLAHQRDPAVNAGADRHVTVGSRVVIDDVITFDWDDDPLTFHWDLASAPTGSNAVIEGTDTRSPALTPDRPGAYELCVTISDGLISDVRDCVTVDTHPRPPRRWLGSS